jgi:hypothetical protein
VEGFGRIAFSIPTDIIFYDLYEDLLLDGGRNGEKRTRRSHDIARLERLGVL